MNSHALSVHDGFANGINVCMWLIEYVFSVQADVLTYMCIVEKYFQILFLFALSTMNKGCFGVCGYLLKCV